MVINPNCQEEDQLAIYKRNREVELGTTENKSVNLYRIFLAS